jgi:methyl-accepting chemotaxis protein
MSAMLERVTGSIEEQNAVVSDLAGRAENAAKASGLGAAGIAEAATAAGRTDAMSDRIRSLASGLTVEAEGLARKVSDFRATVNAA